MPRQMMRLVVWPGPLKGSIGAGALAGVELGPGSVRWMSEADTRVVERAVWTLDERWTDVWSGLVGHAEVA